MLPSQPQLRWAAAVRRASPLRHHRSLRLGRQGRCRGAAWIDPSGEAAKPGTHPRLAARTGLPIVPMGFAYDRPWRLKSWDRFALPRPFSRAASVAGAPIAVPADVTKETMEHYRAIVEQSLDEAIQLAEELAATGVWR